MIRRYLKWIVNALAFIGLARCEIFAVQYYNELQSEEAETETESSFRSMLTEEPQESEQTASAFDYLSDTVFTDRDNKIEMTINPSGSFTILLQQDEQETSNLYPNGSFLYAKGSGKLLPDDASDNVFTITDYSLQDKAGTSEIINGVLYEYTELSVYDSDEIVLYTADAMALPDELSEYAGEAVLYDETSGLVFIEKVKE